jgi:tetratricopeptide (TPR) repeat protein
LATLILTCSGCDSGDKLPKRSSQEYGNVVRRSMPAWRHYRSATTFARTANVGGDAACARRASGGPLGWHYTPTKFDTALTRRRAIAPQDGNVYNLLGILESNRGNSTQAIVNLRKAVSINPQDLRTAYLLAQEIERQGDQNSEAEFQQMIQKILGVQPDNLAALLELSRISAKRGDAATLKSTVAQINARSSAWPPEVQQQVTALQTAAAGTDLRAAATRTTLLRNVLLRVPEFRQSLSVIKPPPGEEARPFTHFLRMESPVFQSALADAAITFELRALADVGNGPWNWIGAVQLGDAGAPIVAAANGSEVHLSTGATLPFPGGPSKLPPLPEGILQIDFNYDFKTDLVLAGAGGVRLFRQDTPSAFTDVTAQTKLPQSVTSARYTGAWAADIEADGDLDIVLGSNDGTPTVLRNNGDGTFAIIQPFAGVSGIRHFAWVDLDGDGVPDAAIVDASGRLHVFINERQGQFRERSLPANLATIKAIAVADANNDGALDLLAVQVDGAVFGFRTRTTARVGTWLRQGPERSRLSGG